VTRRLKGEAVWLLDANLLIALTHAAHVHHREAHGWFADRSDRCFATCALTQLAFVRLSCNPRVVGAEITPAQAMQALGELTAHSGHSDWADTPEPLGLAAQQDQILATLDRGLVSYAAALRLQRDVELVSAPLSVQAPKPTYKRKAA
jgi:toxin-antitoxin system PIN domain toxin